jgi:hypothetical protein
MFRILLVYFNTRTKIFRSWLQKGSRSYRQRRKAFCGVHDGNNDCMLDMIPWEWAWHKLGFGVWSFYDQITHICSCHSARFHVLTDQYGSHDNLVFISSNMTVLDHLVATTGGLLTFWGTVPPVTYSLLMSRHHRTLDVVQRSMSMQRLLWREQLLYGMVQQGHYDCEFLPK